jgi:hypothetical protein
MSADSDFDLLIRQIPFNMNPLQGILAAHFSSIIYSNEGFTSLSECNLL